MKIKKFILLLGMIFGANYIFSQDLLVCGNSVDLSADIENYSSFSWFCDDVNGTFSNSHSLNTTFTLANDVNLQSFLDVRFYYNANVNGEIVSDTINVCFIKQPRAVISMYEGDTLVCGLVTPFLLHADEHGDEISGYWYEENQSTVFGAVNSTNTDATVTSYGNHNFYWVECNGSDDNPQYCKDTAGPWTIRFVRNPSAQINQDEMTFCGYYGQLHADFNGVGVGRWATNVPNNIVAIDDRSNPTTMIHTTILNRDNPSYPYYEIYWTVQNTEYCTDKDTVKVVFAGAPSDSIKYLPPTCFGGPAIITAYEDSLPIYNWNYGTGVLDSVETNSLGGEYRIFVHWEDYQNNHTVDLTTVNSWGCYSGFGSAYINEPNTGKIDASFMISANIDVNNLVAPDAHILYENTTNYGGTVNYICEWHFGDETIEDNCDGLVEHVYVEPDCYYPYLVVFNSDIPQCRDTAMLENCLLIRNDIAEYNMDDISISPNPASNILNITSSETISEIVIVNTLGQVVYRTEVNADNVVCDVEGLTAGVYIVRIHGTDTVSICQRKFIKE